MYTFPFPGQYANVMGYAIGVSVSLFFSVILAKLVGGMLPLAAKKLGADPVSYTHLLRSRTGSSC